MEDLAKLPSDIQQFSNLRNHTQPGMEISDDEKLSEFTFKSEMCIQQELEDLPFLSTIRSVKSESCKSSANQFTLKSHSSENSSKKKEKPTNSNDNSKFSFVSESQELEETDKSCDTESSEIEAMPESQDKDLKAKSCCLCSLL